MHMISNGCVTLSKKALNCTGTSTYVQLYSTKEATIYFVMIKFFIKQIVTMASSVFLHVCMQVWRKCLSYSGWKRETKNKEEKKESELSEVPLK